MVKGKDYIIHSNILCRKETRVYTKFNFTGDPVSSVVQSDPLNSSLKYAEILRQTKQGD